MLFLLLAWLLIPFGVMDWSSAFFGAIGCAIGTALPNAIFAAMSA
jgi:hypothetical protein